MCIFVVLVSTSPHFFFSNRNLYLLSLCSHNAVFVMHDACFAHLRLQAVVKLISRQSGMFNSVTDTSVFKKFKEWSGSIIILKLLQYIFFYAI